MKWQPIETAPNSTAPVLLRLPKPFHSNDVHGYVPWKDIQVVIGWRGGTYSNNELRWICCFMEDGCADTEGYSSQFFMDVLPTHWQPLPSAEL